MRGRDVSNPFVRTILRAVPSILEYQGPNPDVLGRPEPISELDRYLLGAQQDWVESQWDRPEAAPTYEEAQAAALEAEGYQPHYGGAVSAPSESEPWSPAGYEGLLGQVYEPLTFDARDVYEQWMGEASRLMNEPLEPSRVSSGGGGGTAYRDAQRQLQLRQMAEDLALNVTGIERQYQPSLDAQDRAIEVAGERMGEDLGIYSRLMSEVPRIYQKTGRWTDAMYEKAKRALALNSSDARAQIESTFGGAEGRVRAMVLATSKDNPEMVAALTQGLDEIGAYIDRGMAADEAGWGAVVAANHELAQAALTAAMTGTVGEQARASEQTRIQYENAIDDMMDERRRLVQARDLAIQQTRDEAALAVQQLQDQWALAASQGGGGSGRGNPPDIHRILGNLEGYTVDAMRQGAVSEYLTLIQKPTSQGGLGLDLSREEANILATIMLEAGESGAENLTEYGISLASDLNALAGDTSSEGRAQYRLISTMAGFLSDPATLNRFAPILRNGFDISNGVDAMYEEAVRHPLNEWSAMASVMDYLGPYQNVNVDEIMDRVLNSALPTVAAYAETHGGQQAYGQALTNLDLSAIMRPTASTSFTSPLGWQGGP